MLFCAMLPTREAAARNAAPDIRAVYTRDARQAQSDLRWPPPRCRGAMLLLPREPLLLSATIRAYADAVQMSLTRRRVRGADSTTATSPRRAYAAPRTPHRFFRSVMRLYFHDAHACSACVQHGYSRAHLPNGEREGSAAAANG